MRSINRKAIFTSIIILLVMVTGVYAQDNTNQKYDIYLLMGQSNMAGRGPITDAMKEEHNDNVFMFTKDKQWVIAKHPIHFDKPIAGVGPGLTFGIEMEKANPNVKIGLVPCAVGGSPIESWMPGAYDAPTKTHPWDDAVDRIKAAMKYGTIKGVIWHQGESNSNPEKAKIYLAQLTELIQRVRNLVGDPNLPFIAGELGRYRPAYADINLQLVKLPAAVPYTAVASSEGLVHRGDTTHFDGPSAQELGRRYAAKMLQVQKTLKK